VKEGGILETPGHEVEVECLPADLPERIELDVSALEANHSIHVRDIPAMKNVKILTNSELVLAVVKYAKAEAEPVAAAAPAEGAAPAAEGAAPAAEGAAPAAEGAAAAGAAPAAGAKAEKKEAKK
jgi:large subunit ribosomal protein L25